MKLFDVKCGQHKEHGSELVCLQ